MTTAFPNMPDVPATPDSGNASPCRKTLRMRRFMLALAAALSAGAVSAGWESWLGPNVYGVSFVGYKQGESLTDKGADNGTWGDPPVPSGADAYAVVEGKTTYMSCSIPDQQSGLFFRPDGIGDGEQKSVLSRIYLAGYTYLPQMGDDVRAAFSIHAPESGERSFVGWGKPTVLGPCDWQELVSDSASAAKDGWQYLSMRFRRDADGTVYVQYRLAADASSEYKPLRLKNSNSTWLVAGGKGKSILSSVEYNGEGRFENLYGSEPRRGLTAGVGNRRETLYDETVFRHETGSWTEVPAVQGDDYAVIESEFGMQNTFKPIMSTMSGLTVAKFLVSFVSPYEDDAIPSDACASVRMVAETEDVCRFVCLVDGAWVTNTTFAANAESKYTVEIQLDRDSRQVAYQVREGYGAEIGTNVFLCAGKMDAGASGVVKAVDFYGSGLVREIKGQDGK